MASYRYSPAVLPVLLSRIRTGKLPNTRQANRSVWGSYDWSTEGDEWSNNSVPGWKDSLVNNLLIPFIGEGNTVLEVGPGAGRWSEHIIPRSGKTILVDLTPECIDLCQERFGKNPAVEFYVNDGRTLPFIESGSIERVWSVDVFVHIQAHDVENYVAEFARIMAPGAQALIHHAKNGIRRKNWRSDMTASLMAQYVRQNGLEMTGQVQSWGDGTQRIWPTLPPENSPDIISLFRKPTAAGQ